MTLRIGLIGFGRIGRNIFRYLHGEENADIELAAVSDIADYKGLEYLLKYDTLMGPFPSAVSIRDGHLYAGGRQTAMLTDMGPGNIEWGKLGVDIVVEATGRSRTRSEAYKHIEAGAKRVIMCVPTSDDPDITVVMGINEGDITKDHRVISNASITAHCAAPITKLLDDAFGIERMFFTAVHAYTNDQRLADVPADDLRLGRAASENIIPTQTNASKLLVRLFPQLAGKIDGIALKVPVPNGSLVDMSVFTRKPITVTAVNEVVRTGVDAHFKKYVAYTEDPIVSSDVKRSPYSSTFDSLATTVLGDKLLKTMSWYDNGWGYAHRVVDLARCLGKTEAML